MAIVFESAVKEPQHHPKRAYFYRVVLLCFGFLFIYPLAKIEQWYTNRD